VPRDVVQIKRLRDRDAFLAHLDAEGITLPFRPDDAASVLGAPLTVLGRRLPNRFCVLPMEGWDATADGRPTDLVRRRWTRFGASGASLVWGGEAVAVRPDGRANPRQLAIGAHSERDLAALRTLVADEHARASGGGDPPVVGLQLTHSGRWSRPEGVPAPLIAYRHPLLDARVGARAEHVLSDAQLDVLVADFVRAAVVAHDAGFDFVDVKHCHGYLLHELLSAHDRPGRYGGALAQRLTFLDAVVAGIRRDAPQLAIGVRLSAFDVVPHRRGDDGRGEPEPFGSTAEYPYAFGGDGTGIGVDLTEVHALCDHLADLGVTLLCVTAGSPYYSPHVQRPAYFPPSDGYRPPRDPLHVVARLLDVTGRIARRHPQCTVVASGLSYLQEWFPAVAAGVVHDGVAALAGYGRGVLSYPELPLAVLRGEPLAAERLCRTFSDCTTAPRNGLVSGCYPLDPHYKEMPERRALAAVKRRAGSE
jgi:2,4-dienoyl-CoA reductase-like NADH-dependent reductase (Old Yellow Enzyme family)